MFEESSEALYKLNNVFEEIKENILNRGNKNHNKFNECIYEFTVRDTDDYCGNLIYTIKSKIPLSGEDISSFDGEVEKVDLTYYLVNRIDMGVIDDSIISIFANNKILPNLEICLDTNDFSERSLFNIIIDFMFKTQKCKLIEYEYNNSIIRFRERYYRFLIQQFLKEETLIVTDDDKYRDFVFFNGGYRIISIPLFNNDGVISVKNKILFNHTLPSSVVREFAVNYEFDFKGIHNLPNNINPYNEEDVFGKFDNYNYKLTKGYIKFESDFHRVGFTEIVHIPAWCLFNFGHIIKRPGCKNMDIKRWFNAPLMSLLSTSLLNHIEDIDIN